jgi:hypothetical protein
MEVQGRIVFLGFNPFEGRIDQEIFIIDAIQVTRTMWSHDQSSHGRFVDDFTFNSSN